MYMPEGTEAEFPTQFQYDVKVEQTAKGARVTVHARSNDKGVAIQEAVDIYKATATYLKEKGELVAPVEAK